MRVFFCIAIQLLSLGIAAQSETIRITGLYEVFNHYTNMREVKLALGEPDWNSIRHFHASMAGGGSGSGYLGYFVYEDKAVFLHVSQFNQSSDMPPDDELLSVRQAAFKIRKTDFTLNESLHRGSTKREIRRVLGKPSQRILLGFRKGWWYQGKPRAFNLRFNMFGRLRKVIVS